MRVDNGVPALGMPVPFRALVGTNRIYTRCRSCTAPGLIGWILMLAYLFTDARIPGLKATCHLFLLLPLYKKLCTIILAAFALYRRLLPLTQIATMVSNIERNTRAETDHNG